MNSDNANYADTTRYECVPYYDKLKDNLELAIFNWFKHDNFKVNAPKYHFFLSPDHSATINIDGSIIKSSNPLISHFRSTLTHLFLMHHLYP